MIENDFDFDSDTSSSGIENRPVMPSTKRETLALVVPSVPEDVDNLCEMLRRLSATSTSHPDRIVIGVSESGRVSHAQRSQLEQRLAEWQQAALDRRGDGDALEASYFVSCTPNKALAGANRNRAIDLCKECTLIVCHDADDDIHPQKIAMLRHWFAKRPDVLLFNYWLMAYGYEWPRYDDFDAVPIDECDAVQRIGLKFYTSGPLARGHGAFRREVHDAIRFRDNYSFGEDTCFVREVQERFGARCLVLRAALAKYDLFEQMPKALLEQRGDWQRKDEPRGLLVDRTKPDWTAHLEKK